MNQYVKPIISIASGITEGIYTASGVTPNAITLGALEVIADWGTNGQVKFIADFSVLSNRCPLTLTVTFNATISNAWGGGCNSGKPNGNTACFTHETLYYYFGKSHPLLYFVDDYFGFDSYFKCHRARSADQRQHAITLWNKHHLHHHQSALRNCYFDRHR